VELWLVRHGETEKNRAGVWQGQLDVPLSEVGRRQIERLAARLRRWPTRFDRLYTSDLSRARESAEILGRALGLRPIADPRLRELCVGELAGKPREAIFERYAAVMERSRKDPWNTRLPGGESLSDLRARLEAFLTELPEGRHLVVAHAGVVRVFVWMALGLEEGAPWRLRVPNASLSRVVFPDGQAGPVGDACHLEGGEGGPDDPGPAA